MIIAKVIYSCKFLDPIKIKCIKKTTKNRDILNANCFLLAGFPPIPVADRTPSAQSSGAAPRPVASPAANHLSQSQGAKGQTSPHGPAKVSPRQISPMQRQGE